MTAQCKPLKPTDRQRGKRREPSCPCPIYCRYCGAKRKRDVLGHKCPTHNCQWEHGYSTCTLHKREQDRLETLHQMAEDQP